MIQILVAALLGFLAGVVINRAADNLPPPEHKSLIEPARCAYCGTTRAVWEQSGVLLFLLSGARCSHCRAPAPLRAPVTEVASVLLLAFLAIRYNLGPAFLIFAFFTSILLLVTVIDLEHRLILNVVVLPATITALLLMPLIRESAPSLEAYTRTLIVVIALGAVIGYLLVFGIYLFGVVFGRSISRRRQSALDQVAFGMGDVKLAGLVGALVGAPAVITALVYTIILGGIGSLLVLVFQLVVHRRYSAFMAIPYGPFFTITAWALMVGLI